MTLTRIPPETIQAILSATNIGTIAAQYMQLERVRGGYLALCPMHEEKTPSFRVHTKGQHAGYFHCFGCNVNGNAIDLVMNLEQWSFPKAAEHLASIAGIDIRRKKVSPLQIAAAKEDGPCSGWWWNRRREACLNGLYDAMDHADTEWLKCCSRLLRHVESVPLVARLQEFRAEVTSAERKLFRAEVAEDREFASLWMRLAA